MRFTGRLQSYDDVLNNRKEGPDDRFFLILWHPSCGSEHVVSRLENELGWMICGLLEDCPCRRHSFIGLASPEHVQPEEGVIPVLWG